MARKCPVTGKSVQVGHHVSHSNVKTKRRFLPNLQSQSLLSDTLGPVRLRLSAAAIRTIEKNGGLDAYLRGMPDRSLSPEIRRLKKAHPDRRRPPGGVTRSARLRADSASLRPCKPVAEPARPGAPSRNPVQR